MWYWIFIFCHTFICYLGLSMLWHVCTFMAIKLFEIEIENWKFPKIVFLKLNTRHLQQGRLILLQLQCARTICSFICCIGMICKNAASIAAFFNQGIYKIWWRFLEPNSPSDYQIIDHNVHSTDWYVDHFTPIKCDNFELWRNYIITSHIMFSIYFPNLFIWSEYFICPFSIGILVGDMRNYFISVWFHYKGKNSSWQKGLIRFGKNNHRKCIKSASKHIRIPFYPYSIYR